jgi:hypothetical protein
MLGAIIADRSDRYETMLPHDFGARCPVVRANIQAGKRGHEAIMCPDLHEAEQMAAHSGDPEPSIRSIINTESGDYEHLLATA